VALIYVSGTFNVLRIFAAFNFDIMGGERDLQRRATA
jgi:hypothetical protein